MSVGAPLLELRSVSRIYSTARGADGVEVAALRDFTATITAGELVAIIGASGSGKSTLLNIIGCLDRPTSGSYRFEGDEVAHLPDRALARLRNRKIGFIFQSFNLLPRLPALENVAMPLIYAGVPRRERLARAQEELERVLLAGREHHRPNQLSGGQSQRVAIARALVQRPELLLADEPTGNLDSKTGREILDLFVRMNRETGQTVIIVSHDPQVAPIASRVLRIADGTLAEDSAGGAGAARPPAPVRA